jgi:predicted acylesterase/phospholipase RssA
MSIAIPLIFASSEYCGRTYVDGGTAEEYPMAPFLDKKPHEVTCITIKMDEIYQEHLNTPKDFLEALIRSSIKNRLKYDEKCNMIKLDIGDVNIFDFNMSYEDKLRLMNMGKIM